MTTRLRRFFAVFYLHEIIGIAVSLVAAVGFFALSSRLDRMQGQAGFHWSILRMVMDYYAGFALEAVAVGGGTVGLLWLAGQRLPQLRRRLQEAHFWQAIGSLARFGLPLLAVLSLYRTMNFFISVLNPNDKDAMLAAIDRVLFFGHNPSYLLERLITPALTRYLYTVYVAWFPLVFVTILVLFLRGHRDILKQFLLAMLLTFYTGYVSYLFVPAVGPLYAMPFRVDLSGGALGAFTNSLTHDYGIARDVFPSLHTAITLVMFRAVWRAERSLRWPAAILAGSILFSTVYLRFHYVIDVLAGILLALATTWLAPRFNDAWERQRGRWREAFGLQTEAARSRMEAPGQSLAG